MKIKKTIKLNIAMICAISVFFSSSVSAAGISSMGQTIFNSTRQIASNAWYSLRTATNSGILNESHYIEYKPKGGVTPVAVYGSKLYGKSTITCAEDYLSKQGSTVIAGINADFFSLQTGLPLGTVITDGIIRTSDYDRAAVGFKKDGSAIIGYPGFCFTMTTPNGDIEIDHVNKLRTPYGLYLLTSDFSSSTHVSTAGVDVLLKIVDGDLKIGSAVTLCVEDIISNSISMAIPEGYMMLSCDNLGPIDKISGLQIGQQLTLKTTCSDARFEDTPYVVGGGDILIKDGVKGSGFDSDISSTNPRSAIGIKPDGTVVIFEVDGHSSQSAGLSLSDLADELTYMGCVDAINLDGGGSSALTVRLPGEQSTSVVNDPSDGSLRACANYIMLVNNRSPSETPALLHFYPYDPYVLKGSTITFDIKSTDENYYPTKLSSTPVITQTSDIGEIDGLSFKAVSAGETTLEAQSDSASGTTNVTVVESPDSLSVVKDGSKKSISSLTLDAGDQINLNAEAYLNQRQIVSDDSAFSWDLSPSVGTIDNEGILKASDSQGAHGTLSVSAGGKTVNINVTVGKAPITLDKIEKGSSYITSDTNNILALSLNSDRNYVYSGFYSLKAQYDFKDQPSKNNTVCITPNTPLSLPSNPSYINLYIYGDNSKNRLQMNLSDASGNDCSVDITPSVDFEGWKLVSVPVPSKNGLVFNGISIIKTDGGYEKGTLYFDQITVSYGVALSDNIAPVITFIYPNTTESLPNSLEFSATVSDNTGAPIEAGAISVNLDGAPIAYDYNSADLSLKGTLTGLSSGIHRLTIGAVDQSGNYARASSTFVVEQITYQNALKDISGHWAQPYIEFIAAKSIVTGEKAADGYYYHPDRNLTRAEFCAIMTRYLGIDPNDYADTKLPFADQKKFPEWSKNYIKAIYAMGLINGRASGSTFIFDATAPITRAEIMTIIGKTLPKGYSDTNITFNDVSDIPSWALSNVKTLIGIGVVNGYEDNTIKPNRYVLRSEVARILYNLY